MKFILARKIGMTRVFDEEGRSFAVTKISALPCAVSQIKDKEKDKYKAVQVSAYKTADKKKVSKVAEFKEQNVKRYKVGEEITTKQFKKGEIVTVEGTGKGKGFAGTIKRHGFAMGPVSHGSKNVRKPGSIGGGYPQRVVLGRKMAGRMGGKNVTVSNLKIIDVDDQILLIAGSIPGANKSIVKVYGYCLFIIINFLFSYLTLTTRLISISSGRKKNYHLHTPVNLLTIVCLIILLNLK
jgi:large subunit ribosomal protein L3